MSDYLSNRVIMRFIVLLGVLTFVVYLFWTFREYLSPPPGDFEVREGDILLQDENFAEAAVKFDEALRISPNHRGALGGKAVALIALERYDEAEAVLGHTIDYLSANLDPEDATGKGALAAAYANRGIIRDRRGRHKEALEDYIESIKLDYDLAEGPGWLNHLLYHDREPSSVLKRAEYLYRQFQLPESERLMRVPERDAEQRIYKPR